MLKVTPYTNTTAIRAVFGVTDNEITDEMLVQNTVEEEIKEALAEVDASYDILFFQGVSAGATDAQKRVHRCMFSYATYVAACSVRHLAMSAPERFTDGKTGFTRGPVDKLLGKLYADVEGQREKWLRRLKDALGQPALTVTPLTAGARPTYDPVTDN